LGRLAPRVRPGLRLLPGLARAARWREVSAAAVAEILQVAGREHSWVVVEAPVLVPEEDSAFGFGPGRNDVAGAVLGAAEEIAVVGAAEPVGMERLVQTLLDLDDLTTPGRRHVLVNRVRASAAGPRAAASVQEALARFADVQAPVLIPDDRAMCDRCVLEGTTWRESSGRSPALRALSDFTAGLPQVTTGTGRRPRPSRRGLLRWRDPAQRRTPAHSEHARLPTCDSDRPLGRPRVVRPHRPRRDGAPTCRAGGAGRRGDRRVRGPGARSSGLPG